MEDETRPHALPGQTTSWQAIDEQVAKFRRRQRAAEEIKMMREERVDENIEDIKLDEAEQEQLAESGGDPNCGFCKRRGEPCVKHGGSAATYKPKRQIESASDVNRSATEPKPIHSEPEKKDEPIQKTIGKDGPGSAVVPGKQVTAEPRDGCECPLCGAPVEVEIESRNVARMRYTKRGLQVTYKKEETE